MVKNPRSSAGDVGSIPGWRTKIPHAMGQLSPHAATTEPMSSGARAPQLQSPHTLECTTTREKPACRNERSHVLQLRPDAAKNK